MLFIITVKNGIATAKAEGFESSISMPESYMAKHMKDVSAIGKAENIQITWKVIYA